MISVLMSTYKESLSYIKQSVESILEQSYKEIEFIIVVDNPEYSDLINLLNSYSDKDSRIKILVNNKNLGLTYSLNRALKYASGQYIARMDADDISDRERLKKQLLFLEKNHLDLVGSNVQDIDEHGEKKAGVSYFPETNSKVVRYAKFDSPVAHPTWFAKKEVFESLGGYHEIDACEDYDFLVRAILKGFKIGNVQETLLKYRINSKGISSTKKTAQKLALEIIRNNYRCGKETTEQEYIIYINSSEGKKKCEDLKLYYQKTDRLKNVSGKKIKKMLFKAYIFVTSKEGRRLVYNLLQEKAILGNRLFT